MGYGADLFIAALLLRSYTIVWKRQQTCVSRNRAALGGGLAGTCKLQSTPKDHHFLLLFLQKLIAVIPVASCHDLLRERYDLNSLLSEDSDFLIRNNGDQVPVTELEGNIVGLYFCVGSNENCIEFTLKLLQFYNELKEKGENFEIVFISVDYGDEAFREELSQMPWLALLFNNNKSKKLAA